MNWILELLYEFVFFLYRVQFSLFIEFEFDIKVLNFFLLCVCSGMVISGLAEPLKLFFLLRMMN